MRSSRAQRALGRDPQPRGARRLDLAGARPALDVGRRVDLGPRLEGALEHLGGLDAIQAEVAHVVLGRVEAGHVPALAPVDERVGLHRALGELVLVGLVVLQAQQVAGDDRLRRHPSDDRVVATLRGDLQPLLHGVGPQRGDDLLARAGQRALGEVLADQVDGGDERLGLDRQQPRRPREVVRVGLGVDLDPAVVAHLGVEDVGAAAEVHDVEDVDVLAQLGPGDLQALADALLAQALARAARLDEDRGERDQAREALGADGGLAAPVALDDGVRRLVGRRRRDRRGQQRLGLVQLGHARHALGDDVDELGGTLDAGVLAQAQRPAGELARARVAGREEHAVLRGDEAAEAPVVALDEPRDAIGDPHLGRPDVVAVLPVGAVGVLARIEVLGALEVVLGLRGVGDLALDARQAEDAQRVALVRSPQHVELPAAEEQVIGIDLARAEVVAFHRVVVERDRLLAEDGRLDLGQALGEVVAAGAPGDAERQPALVGCLQR